MPIGLYIFIYEILLLRQSHFSAKGGSASGMTLQGMPRSSPVNYL